MDVLAYIMSKKYVDQVVSDLDSLQGKSAYEIAVEQGFSGTEAEWLKSLEGESGVYVGSGEMPDDCNVQIDPEGDASQVVLCTPQNLTPEQQAQALANLGLNELPTGDSSSVFHFTTTTTEAVNRFQIELPTTFENIHTFNVHVTFGTIENDISIVGVYGGSYGVFEINTKDLVTGQKYGVNVYCIRYYENYFSYCITKSGYTYVAYPSVSNIRISPYTNSNIIEYYSNTADVLIPAGTTFEIWGLCK